MPIDAEVLAMLTKIDLRIARLTRLKQELLDEFGIAKSSHANGNGADAPAPSPVN
jgi:translation elongation factor EF-4